MNKPFFRRILSLVLAMTTLWVCIVTAGSQTLSSAVAAMRRGADITGTILRWELGDFFLSDSLSPVTVLALSQSPLLMAQKSSISALIRQEESSPAVPENGTNSSPAENISSPQDEPPTMPEAGSLLSDDLAFLDNGAPAQTVHVTSSKGYTVVNGVFIKNASSRKLSVSALEKCDFSARLSSDGPQVLIVHSHGSEAYTMPKGQEYKASGTFRTADTSCNVVRIGDEIAAVLSTYGISVLHDRTLHDVPSYNDAYISSQASIERYLEKYPSISFVLDVHRDAVQDGKGNYYKLVSKEDPNAAQCSLVMGLAHDNWLENLKLAIAVQQTVAASSPTLMRPIAARDYRYNQHLSTGSLLVEIGAAGNSLDEAILGGRLFARGFAETILHP